MNIYSKVNHMSISMFVHIILFYELYNYLDVLFRDGSFQVFTWIQVFSLGCTSISDYYIWLFFNVFYVQLLFLSSVFCICLISGTLCKHVCKAFKVTLFENKVYKQTNKAYTNAHTDASESRPMTS